MTALSVCRLFFLRHPHLHSFPQIHLRGGKEAEVGCAHTLFQALCQGTVISGGQVTPESHPGSQLASLVPQASVSTHSVPGTDRSLPRGSPAAGLAELGGCFSAGPSSWEVLAAMGREQEASWQECREGTERAVQALLLLLCRYVHTACRKSLEKDRRPPAAALSGPTVASVGYLLSPQQSARGVALPDQPPRLHFCCGRARFQLDIRALAQEALLCPATCFSYPKPLQIRKTDIEG